MAGNYRDCQAWRDDRMPLSSSSNEACKMYDAAVKLLCTRQNDAIIGDAESAVSRMMQADPNCGQGCVMGHICMKYTGMCNHLSKPLFQIVESGQLTNLEQMHCGAVEYYSNGQNVKACEQWEKILNTYPKDFLSLKMLYESQLFLGKFEEQKADVEKVLPYYKKNVDLEYGYVVGMLAFSLEETNNYVEAEKRAFEALDCDRHDAWATHSMAHVFEMTGRYNEGIDFMSATQKDWEIITALNCHIHWHNSLYYIEKGDFEGALNLYDNNVASQISRGMFEVSDAVATLYRLKLEGVDVGKQRWKDLADELNSYMNDHGWAFFDACVMLGLCGAELKEESATFLQSIKDMVSTLKEDSSDVVHISKSVNQFLCEAILCFEEGQHEKAVDMLLSVKDNIVNIGGSYAQRDVFNLILIHAASASHRKEDNQLALKLVEEKKNLKDTPLTQRLLTKVRTKQQC